MVKIMERRKLWFMLSALFLIPGLVSLFVWGLRLGIDFKGGSITEYSYAGSAEQGRVVVKKAYEDEGLANLRIDTGLDSNDANPTRLFVKSQSISNDKHFDIVRRLNEANPPAKELSFETIDPQVGKDVTQKAGLAVIFSSLAIIAYIALSFRGVPKPASSWQFGIFAVIALLHDVLFILGFYSLMGHFFNWEVTSEFVVVTLTVMGFSVHDTIVVFDRLRENLKRIPSRSFREIANISIAQTIGRSLNTSITVLLVLLALALLGGETTRASSITLFVGIAVGTYSSIFVATALLDWWQDISKRVRLPQLRRTAQSRIKTA